MKRRAVLCAPPCAWALAWPGRGTAATQPALDAMAGAAPAVHSVVEWVLRSGDHHARSFALLDKTAARLFVFTADGVLQASSPVLLGSARGDHTVPGIGNRPIDQVRPHERTTPAGRFVLELGRNTRGEDILWVDYAAAVSIHRLRALVAAERRVERLASPSSADNRISFGCINVPPAFFDGVMRPAFVRPARMGRGVLYILPEVLPLAQVFPGTRALHRL